MAIGFSQFKYLINTYIVIIGTNSNKQIEKLNDEAQSMLIQYDHDTYPELIARPGSLLSIMNNLQQVANSLGKLLFPKLSDIKNLVHHIHTTILNENLRHATF